MPQICERFKMQDRQFEAYNRKYYLQDPKGTHV